MYSLFARSAAFDQIHPLHWFTSGLTAGAAKFQTFFHSLPPSNAGVALHVRVRAAAGKDSGVAGRTGAAPRPFRRKAQEC